MIYENEYIFIEKEEHQIPWVKIFAKKSYKELSDCDAKTLDNIFKTIIIVEKALIEFYNPDKVNIASFANYLPKVHVHVQARFKNDSYFPESVWGVKQREANLSLPNFEDFTILLKERLKNI